VLRLYKLRLHIHHPKAVTSTRGPEGLVELKARLLAELEQTGLVIERRY
jgi:hypothetical protein